MFNFEKTCSEVTLRKISELLLFPPKNKKWRQIHAFFFFMIIQDVTILGFF